MTTPCYGCRGRYPLDQRLLVIERAHDADVLLRTRGRFDAIVIRLDAVPMPERDALARRLLAAYGECGCDAGGIALLIALIIVAAAALTRHGQSWVMGLSFCFAAALLGKAMGIAAARLRLWRDVRRLRQLHAAAAA